MNTETKLKKSPLIRFGIGQLTKLSVNLNLKIKKRPLIRFSRDQLPKMLFSTFSQPQPASR